MSRKIPLTALLLCCLLGWARASLGQAPVSAQQQQMIAADRAIFEALAGAQPDVAKLEKLLAPEYSELDDGELQNRAELIRTDSKVSQFSFTYNDPVAVSTSPASGYVIATLRYSFTDNVYTRKLYVKSTTVFSRRNGQWLATLHTEMPMPFDPETIRATPEDSNPSLIAMRKLAAQVISAVHIPGYAPFPYYNVSLDAGAGVSYSNSEGAHAADFTRLPLPMQQIWNQWAGYTTGEPSGQALFEDMFYRFFMVHELGHLIAGRVIDGLPDAERQQAAKNMAANATGKELVPNRIAVAWFREHDPQYLARLVADFRRIQSHLPNPVPAGADPKHYFTENYSRLGADPIAYGWYQLYMVTSVYEEPAKTFQQMLNTLPTLRYTED